MILVPVLTGLAGHRILYGRERAFTRVGPLAGVAAGCLALAAAAAVIPGSPPGVAALRNGLMIGFGLMGVVAAARLVVGLWLGRTDNWMERALTFLSMAGICLIIGIITARSRDKLLTVGPLLLFAAALHNALGYALGYWGARAVRLDERTCRTVAIEVGMQNAGMASGLAMSVLQSANAALAPAIFGPWMNLSGSLLASWWKRRPVAVAAPTSPPTQP
jgi:BASS family bile acid:Na+ symporter